ncbi:MAG: hypothetical protein KJ607_10885 [Bacteroidetes bacterium]|nr:hypothetical protein [Bacteroidota bacterium]
MKTKSLILKGLLISGIILLGLSLKTFACEFEFEVQGDKKEIYKAGDEVIVKVTVIFTHRVCELAITETKFETKGLEIISATDWKETSTGTWERKLKMKVTGTPKGKLTLTGTRTCSKEGGFGIFTLEGEPVAEEDIQIN